MSGYGSGAAIIIAAVILSIVSVLAARRHLGLRALMAQREAAGLFSGLVGATYAIVVAFLVVMVWDDFSDTRTAVHAEANRLSDLANLAGNFDPSDEARVRRALLTYARTAMDHEWPAMAERRDSTETRRAFRDLWMVYRHIEPEGKREEAAYGESLNALSDLSDYRRVRLAASRERIAGVMWTLLIGGAVLIVALTHFFATESLAAHAALTAILALLIAFNLFLIFALDRPFSSGPGISAAPLSGAVEHISAEPAE